MHKETKIIFLLFNENIDLILSGHLKSGYGLCWNPNSEGTLISCGTDGLVCMWDINSGGGKPLPVN